MELDRMKVALQTTKDTIAIMENVEQPDDAGYYLQLEHEKFVAECIEKQIPKKYIENRYPWAICPVCGGSINVENVQEHIQNGETTYCEHCGQALDWSGTNG